MIYRKDFLYVFLYDFLNLLFYSLECMVSFLFFCVDFWWFLCAVSFNLVHMYVCISLHSIYMTNEYVYTILMRCMPFFRHLRACQETLNVLLWTQKMWCLLWWWLGGACIQVYYAVDFYVWIVSFGINMQSIDFY